MFHSKRKLKFVSTYFLTHFIFTRTHWMSCKLRLRFLHRSLEIFWIVIIVIFRPTAAETFPQFVIFYKTTGLVLVRCRVQFRHFFMMDRIKLSISKSLSTCFLFISVWQRVHWICELFLIRCVFWVLKTVFFAELEFRSRMPKSRWRFMP